MMRARIRRAVLTVLADAAAAVNEFFYEMAIKANKMQGWLLRHRGGFPGAGQ